VRRLGLAVVTQPAFVFERGDRFLDDTPADEHGDLYRCASLRAAGVAVAASSDAPYGPLDPWAAMRAATRRLTRGGRTLGPGEIVAPRLVLDMFLSGAECPGGTPRQVRAGAAADLVLLNTTLRDALDALTADLVCATFIGGEQLGTGAQSIGIGGELIGGAAFVTTPPMS